LLQRAAVHELPDVVVILPRGITADVVKGGDRWVGLPSQHAQRVPLVVVAGHSSGPFRSGTKQRHLQREQPLRFDDWVPCLVESPGRPAAQLCENLVAADKRGLSHRMTSTTEAERPSSRAGSRGGAVMPRTTAYRVAGHVQRLVRPHPI